jgi:hypothetical protein
MADPESAGAVVREQSCARSFPDISIAVSASRDEDKQHGQDVAGLDDRAASSSCGAPRPVIGADRSLGGQVLTGDRDAVDRLVRRL